MLTCKEFSRLVATDELSRLDWLHRLEARIHVWLCRHCRRYRDQIHALGAAARRAWSGFTGDPARTDELTRRILESLERAQEPGRPDTKNGEAGPET